MRPKDARAGASEVVDGASDRVLDVEDTTVPPPLGAGCEREPELASIAIAEASGAAALDGRRIIVTSDSGGDGADLIVDLLDWASVATTLPLGDGASDDIEGLSRSADGRIVGVTSSGYVREWRWDDEALTLAAGPYALSEDESFACEGAEINCAKNYEGVCLHPSPPEGGCVGFALGKADNSLNCLVRDERGRLAVDTAQVRTLVRPLSDDPNYGQLSGCAFEPEAPHRLVVAGNILTGSGIWEVIGWQDVATATATRLAGLEGPVNQEAIIFEAVGVIVSFGDLQDHPSGTSPVERWRCEGAATP